MRIKTGTRILRKWKEEMHEVLVTKRGYEYRGACYKSLSVIARQITHTRWSGPAFFGLNKPSGGNVLTFKSGFSKDRAPIFEVHKVSDSTHSITPQEPLRPGEYMITINPGTSGYDFSVQ